MSEALAKLDMAALAAKIAERFPNILARLHEAELAEAAPPPPSSEQRED
jgi:hypothetical protein